MARDSASLNAHVLQLPFSWGVDLHLPTLGDTLPTCLTWPSCGQALVELHPVTSPDEPVALVIREVTSDRELLDVASRAAARGAGAVLFTASDISESAQGEAQEFSAVAVPPPAHLSGLGDVRFGLAVDGGVGAAAGVPRAPSALAGAAVGARGRAGDRDVGAPPSPAHLTRPTMAPLSMILNAHVAGGLGLWWPGAPKPAEHLGVSAPTLRRARGRVPDAIQAALAPPPERKRVLSLLLVEDDEMLARATERLLGQLATRLDRELSVTWVSSAEAARRHVEESGAPELVWADIHLETLGAGRVFVEWLRQASSVVLGKTASLADVRRMTQLGALSVWVGDRPGALRYLLSDGLRAADEVAEITRLEEATEKLAVELRSRFAHGLQAADALQELLRTRRIVEGLEHDALPKLPAEVGDAAISLAALERLVAGTAIEIAGSVHAAARALKIDRKRLRRILSTT